MIILSILAFSALLFHSTLQQTEGKGDPSLEECTEQIRRIQEALQKYINTLQTQYTTGNAFEFAIEQLREINEEAVIFPQFYDQQNNYNPPEQNCDNLTIDYCSSRIVDVADQLGSLFHAINDSQPQKVYDLVKHLRNIQGIIRNLQDGCTLSEANPFFSNVFLPGQETNDNPVNFNLDVCYAYSNKIQLAIDLLINQALNNQHAPLSTETQLFSKIVLIFGFINNVFTDCGFFALKFQTLSDNMLAPCSETITQLLGWYLRARDHLSQRKYFSFAQDMRKGIELLTVREEKEEESSVCGQFSTQQENKSPYCPSDIEALVNITKLIAKEYQHNSDSIDMRVQILTLIRIIQRIRRDCPYYDRSYRTAEIGNLDIKNPISQQEMNKLSMYADILVVDATEETHNITQVLFYAFEDRLEAILNKNKVA